MPALPRPVPTAPLAVAAYLGAETAARRRHRPGFVVLKGPRRGQPLTAKGVEVVLSAARRGAGPGWTTPPATSCGTPA